MPLISVYAFSASNAMALDVSCADGNQKSSRRSEKQIFLYHPQVRFSTSSAASSPQSDDTFTRIMRFRSRNVRIFGSTSTT